MLPQDDSATATTAAQGLASPNEHIVQRAHGWNATHKKVIGSTGKAKDSARSQHRLSEQKLAEACDYAAPAAGAQP